MKKLLILITFISSLIYAQNCEKMEEERINWFQQHLYETAGTTIKIYHGVSCDVFSYYWEGIIVRTNTEVCAYYNSKNNTQDIIMGNEYTFVEYDEFDIPITKDIIPSNKMTCSKIYQKFKKDMKLKRR